MEAIEIIQRANKVIENNYIKEPPIPVREISENYEIAIEERNFPPKYAHISGFISNVKGICTMIINQADSINRKNFTIAHELGHWLLHRDKLDTDPNLSILFRIPIGRLNTDPLEKEANTFAGNLLVPKNMLLDNDGKTQRELSQIFDVSEEVIGYRKGFLVGSN